MIDKVSFAGREGLLTGNIKEVAQKKPVTNYITESTILPKMKEETKVVAPDISSEKLNEAYKAAHAPFLHKPEEKAVADKFILDGQQY